MYYFDFSYNSDKNELVTIDIPDGECIGKQLFNIGTAYTYSVNNEKKLVFLNFENNLKISYWEKLFDNKLNIINYDLFSNIQFKIIENNNSIIKENNKDNIYLKGHYYNFINFNSKNNTTRCFLRHLVYSNEEFMYCSYNIYNSIKKYFEKMNNVTCYDDDIVSLHIKINNNYTIQYYNDAIKINDNNNIQYYNDAIKINDNNNIQYYNDAIKRANKKNIVIFSNNIEWCKINKDSFDFDDKILYFVDINIITIEFILMSMIKHNIISNSSYSLMASYISYYDTKKIIIAPKSCINYHEDITDII
jgi:hypothetical protein